MLNQLFLFLHFTLSPCILCQWGYQNLDLNPNWTTWKLSYQNHSTCTEPVPERHPENLQENEGDPAKVSLNHSQQNKISYRQRPLPELRSLSIWGWPYSFSPGLGETPPCTIMPSVWQFISARVIFSKGSSDSVTHGAIWTAYSTGDSLGGCKFHIVLGQKPVVTGAQPLRGGGWWKVRLTDTGK